MLPPPRAACLIIADISGYTSYLAAAELDHAQDILADLMATVVGAFRPSFKLAKLEGDAAFVFAVTDAVDASVLQDAVEGCYFAFQRRRRDIRQATTCPCEACVRIPTLDLKLIAHHGIVAEQKMAGRAELVGRDVIVVHRLLKNDIETSLGVAAYAAYTDACVAAMGIDDPAAAGLRSHRETYDVLGEVRVWVRDLSEAWREHQARAEVVIDEADSGWSVSGEVTGPPALVWPFLTAPAHRLVWGAGITGFAEQTAAGRRGVGTVSHCQHGAETNIEEILDWQPPHHETVRVQMPVPGLPKLTYMYLLEPIDDEQTRITMRVLRPKSRKDQQALAMVWPMIEPSIRAGTETLDGLLRAEVARLADEPADAGTAAVVDSGHARSS